jgi:inward rectifier potassium channel
MANAPDPKRVVRLAADPRSAIPRIETRGRRLAPYEDLYHWVLTLTWPRFFGAVSFSFMAINGIFAGLYELSPGCIVNANSFLDLFFFSIQTLGTIGYGGMSPQTRYGNVIVSFEALFGIITTAVITGLTFARFAKPTAKIIFSDKAVIAPRNGVPHLMFRLGNFRRNQIVEATMHAMVLLTETSSEGETMRRPTPLRLVRNTNQLFALTWTVMHTIDETSPFFGPDALEKLAAQNAEVFLSVAGLDETISQTVHARFRYPMSDIIQNARFADVLVTHEDGTRFINFDAFDDLVMLDEKKS